jgi:hypothetical protein
MVQAVKANFKDSNKGAGKGREIRYFHHLSALYNSSQVRNIMAYKRAIQSCPPAKIKGLPKPRTAKV